MIHVYPIGDIEEHLIDGSTCWCVPTLKEHHGEMILVHNAFDGRILREPIEEKSDISICEGNLVMVRLTSNNTSFRAWLRVKFVDINNTFVGKIELIDKDSLHKINDTLTLHIDDVIEIFSPNDGKDWCYSDGITRCNCKGLCRNK